MALDIYVACRDAKEAEKIATHLLKKKLIACANMFPVKSMYQWKGRMVKDTETAMLIKAPSRNFRAIEKEMKKLHSYTVPCIVAIDIKKMSKEYSKWLSEVTK